MHSNGDVDSPSPIVQNLQSCEDGSGFVEKIIILALFAFVVALGVRTLGDDSKDKLAQQGECIGALEDGTCSGQPGTQSQSEAPGGKESSAPSHTPKSLELRAPGDDSEVPSEKSTPSPGGEEITVTSTSTITRTTPTPPPVTDVRTYQKDVFYVVSGFGDEVDKLINLSSTLSINMHTLWEDGYTFEYGPAGEGTYVSKESKEIIIDGDSFGDPLTIVGSLAHETGHAMYEADSVNDITVLRKEVFTKESTDSSLKDEGEAALSEFDIYEEIKKNGGPTFEFGGVGEEQYKEIYLDYLKHHDRDKARKQIADIWREVETPSGGFTDNYDKVYTDSYNTIYNDEAYYYQHGTYPDSE